MTDLIDIQAQAASIIKRANDSQRDAKRFVSIGTVPADQRKRKARSTLETTKFQLLIDQKKFIASFKTAIDERLPVLSEIHPPDAADRDKIQYTRDVVKSQLATQSIDGILTAFQHALERGDKIEVTAYTLEVPLAIGTADKVAVRLTQGMIEKARPLIESTRQQRIRAEIAEIRAAENKLRREVMGAIVGLDSVPDIPEVEVW